MPIQNVKYRKKYALQAARNPRESVRIPNRHPRFDVPGLPVSLISPRKYGHSSQHVTTTVILEKLCHQTNAPCHYAVLVGRANGDSDLLELIDCRSYKLQRRSNSRTREFEKCMGVGLLTQRFVTRPRHAPSSFDPHQNCVVPTRHHLPWES